MLALFLKSYFTVILTIIITGTAIFSVGSYCLLRRFWFRLHSPKLVQQASHEEGAVVADQEQDISAIAGDDLVATQLDLARAYIETNQKQQALMILEIIIMQGSLSQQEEAKELMNFL